jgi:ribonuclease R
MRDRVGDVFDGTISSVVAFGIFVALDGVYVEGLVHVSDLGSDYFHFDAAKHQLIGERTAKRYRLGDRVRVRVVRVDIESSKIDFVLEESAGLGAGRPASKVKRK